MREIDVKYRLVTAPTVEPFTSQDESLRAHLRLDHHDDDALIEDYIRAARVHLEDIANIVVMQQTWEMVLPCFQSEITIRKRPIPWEVDLGSGLASSILSVKYTDSAGVLQTVPTADYQVDCGFLARIRPGPGLFWPISRLNDINAVVVRFVAGYGTTPDDVNPAVMAAMRLHIGHLYEHRESVANGNLVNMPMGYEALLSGERVISV